MTYKEVAELINVSPARFLKNSKEYSKLLAKFNISKVSGRGKSAIYVRNNSNEYLESYLRISSIFNLKEAKLNNILLFISMILEQSSSDFYTKQNYLKRLNITSRTFDNYKSFLVKGCLVKPSTLSKQKYIAIKFNGVSTTIDQELFYSIQRRCANRSNAERLLIFELNNFKSVYSISKLEVTNELFKNTNFLIDLYNSIMYVKDSRNA